MLDAKSLRLPTFSRMGPLKRVLKTYFRITSLAKILKKGFIFLYVPGFIFLLELGATFMFDNKTYIRLDGVAVGSSLGPILTRKIFLCNREQHYVIIFKSR